MDSLTQALLGASIAEFLGGKKYGNKAPLVGAIVATIPDLDVFIGPLLYNDSLQAEFFHRSVTHSLFFSLLAAPIIGWIISKIIPMPREAGTNDTKNNSQKSSRRDRTVISFRALATHRMLDFLTGYGTQRLWPFSTVPRSVDSIFIIDPLYTIPFFVFFMIALFYHQLSNKRRFRNGLALIVSTLYLLRGIGVKLVAQEAFASQLNQQGIAFESVHTSAEALTTFLRRGRAQDEKNWYIGRRSVWDDQKEISRKVYPKHHELLVPYLDNSQIQKVLARRRHRFVIQPTEQGMLLIPMQFGDLLGRNQQEPNFMFSYHLITEGVGIRIEEPSRGRLLPAGRQTILRKRIWGIQKDPTPPLPTVSVGESCIIDTDCETPMDYLIRSICPFSSKCIAGTCHVVCVDRYDTQKQELRNEPQCSVDEQCDCSTFYGADDIMSCACIDGLCAAVVE